MAKIVGLDGMSAMELNAELQKGGKFVVYLYCISILIMTFKRGSNVYFIRDGESAIGRGLLFTLLSLVLGWWGIPWGPIYTVEALVTNFKGGKDVTPQIVASMRRASAPPAQSPSASV
jgi:hypothetical protein